MKLLLAEDEPRNRDMLSRRLQRRGFVILEAINGKEAVDAVETQAPDLIIMDLAMPMMNGWDAIAHIRARDTRTPIIVLTAHSLNDEQARAFRAGAQAYLTKPIDFEELVATIDRLHATIDGC